MSFSALPITCVTIFTLLTSQACLDSSSSTSDPAPNVTSSYPELAQGDGLRVAIEQLRKAPINITVVNGQNEPVSQAQVHLEQLSHDFPLGVALSTDMFEDGGNKSQQESYRKIAQELFNAAVHENALKWYATEPERGQVSYDDADRILAWSQGQGWTMRGHTLFWEDEQFNQSWLKDLPPQELRVAVQKRAMEVCRRYRGKIDEFDVNNELLHGDFYRSRLGPGIIKEMFEWCHQGNPDAVLYVNDFGIIEGDRLDDYATLIRDLLDQGVPIGGIGIQAHLEYPLNEERMQRALNTLAQFNLPIKLTEISVSLDSEAEQAETLRNIYRIAFAHPAVEEILLWGFWQGNHWRPQAALYRQDFSPKPAAEAYRSLIFEEWWTEIQGQTNDEGHWSDRGFLGQYQIRITANGQELRENIELTRSGANLTFRLP